MRVCLFFLLGFVCINTSVAQIPQFINYQAVARYTNSNLPIPHQPIFVNFKIRENGILGRVLFSENQTDTTDDCGLFNLKIGALQPAAFKLIDWSTGAKFLEVNVNGVITGISALSSIPYSFYAQYAKSSLDWKNVGDTVLYSLNKSVGIGTTAPRTMLHVKGEGIVMRLEGETHSFLEFNSAGSDIHRGWIGYGNATSPSLTIANDQGHIILSPIANVGIGTSAPEARLDVNGSAAVTCLTIKGGCDWYEEANATQPIKEGYVTVIDTGRSVNSVKLSSHAYDNMVTGVVSGAGGINPGIGLQQQGVLQGNTKIAMGGKVKVYTTGIVKPGDLLTSSDLPGYAMVVKKRKKAFGAVLGKALSMPDNDHLVLMQVMMQ